MTTSETTLTADAGKLLRAAIVGLLYTIGETPMYLMPAILGVPRSVFGTELNPGPGWDVLATLEDDGTIIATDNGYRLAK